MMNKEKIKQFLKPNWRKVVLFVILAIILSSIKYNERYGSLEGFIDTDFYMRGLPLPFEMLGGIAGLWFSPLVLFVDVLIWYFLSCLIISVYDKLKGRKI